MLVAELITRAVVGLVVIENVVFVVLLLVSVVVADIDVFVSLVVCAVLLSIVVRSLVVFLKMNIAIRNMPIASITHIVATIVTIFQIAKYAF